MCSLLSPKRELPSASKKKKGIRENYLCIPHTFGPTCKNKVFLQTSLERNPTNSSYIFILSVNFENLTVRVLVFIIFFMHVKFQEYQKSIAISSNKY